MAYSALGSSYSAPMDRGLVKYHDPNIIQLFSSVYSSDSRRRITNRQVSMISKKRGFSIVVPGYY